MVAAEEEAVEDWDPVEVVVEGAAAVVEEVVDWDLAEEEVAGAEVAEARVPRVERADFVPSLN